MHTHNDKMDKKLKDYISFLKKNHLKEHVEYYLEHIKKLDIPLLKLFSQLTDEQLNALSLEGQTKFLENFENGTEYEVAAQSLKDWENNNLPGIPKEAIHPSDLVFIYKAQRLSLIRFLPLYTSDATEVINITIELEDYFSEIQNNAIKVLFKMQKEAEDRLKLHEAQLEEQNKILNNTQELAKIGSYEWDLKTNKIKTSQEMDKIMDIDTPHHVWNFDSSLPSMHPEDKDQVNTAIAKSIQEKCAFDMFYRIITTKGNLKIVQGKGEVIVDENNEAVKVVGTVQDLTQIKLIKRELEHKNQQLSLVQHIARIGSCEWDPVTNKLTGTDELAIILELPACELKDFEVELLVNITHPNDKYVFENHIRSALKSKGAFEFIQRIIASNNKQKVLHTIGHFVTGEKDAQGKMILTFQDITDVESLKELNQLKDQFIGMASHELKTPLTTLVAYVHILNSILEVEEDSKIMPIIGKISKQISRLRSLIEQLLDLSMIETGNMSYNMNLIHFGKLVKDWKESFEIVNHDAEILIEGLMDCEITADEFRLEQVFNNLTSNALKYSPGQNQVKIIFTDLGDYIQVEIVDKGLGIPKDKLDKLFRKFSRLEGTAQKFSGLGLGLFITKEIIKKHGGSISVKSEPNQGSVFSFTIAKNSGYRDHNILNGGHADRRLQQMGVL